MNLLTVIVLLPLAGFLLNGLLGRASRPGVRHRSSGADCRCSRSWPPSRRVALLAAAGPEASLIETAYTWASIGDISFDVAFYFDRLSAVMTLVVTGVGSLIHVYSTGYMKDDPGYARYFAYLNLFLFFMLTLVLGRSLLVLFVGWEGVGLASYLLIGFWFEDPVKAAAGKKAFITNRVGDAGFLLGLFLLYHALGTLDTDQINAAYLGTSTVVPTVSASLVGVLLFIGATRQVGADPAARLAAGRDGRSDAGLGADPRGHDGDRRRLPGGAPARHLRARARGLARRRRRRRADRLLRGDDRDRADGHQEGARLFHDLATRLHVRRTRRRRVWGRGLPRGHARILQGVPVPRRGQRDPRARRRAGRAPDGRTRAQDPVDLRHVRRRNGRDRGTAAARRVLLEGRDSLVRLRERARRRTVALGAGVAHRADHRLLHVPPAVAHVPDAFAHERTRSSTTCTSRRSR